MSINSLYVAASMAKLAFIDAKNEPTGCAAAYVNALIRNEAIKTRHRLTKSQFDLMCALDEIAIAHLINLGYVKGDE